MNKKGAELTTEQIVIAIITLVVFIILFGAYKPLLQYLRYSGEDRTCAMSAIANAHTKTFGTETIKLKCPINFETVKLKDLKSGRRKAEKTIANHNKKFKDQQFEKWPEETMRSVKGDEKDKLLDEFVLNEIVATHMKRCWEKLGKGELNLFAEWWKPLGYEKEIEYWPDYLKLWNIGMKDPPRFCVVCSRVKFEEELREYFKDQGYIITSMEDWLNKNGVPPTRGYSYREYLKAGSSTKDIYDNYDYSVSEPLAVLFVRINRMKPGKFFEKFVPSWGTTSNEEEETEPYNSMYILPYQNVETHCTYLAN